MDEEVKTPEEMANDETVVEAPVMEEGAEVETPEVAPEAAPAEEGAE